MELLKSKYVPNDYARIFMPSEVRDKAFRVRVETLEGVKDWAYFYAGSKKVWSCNYEFFKAHFIGVRKKGKRK